MKDNEASEAPGESSARPASVELQPIRTTPSSPMFRVTSHMSGVDNLEPDHPQDKYWETGDEVYDRLSRARKRVIVAVLSFCAFLSPVSSTSVLAATPEVAAEYDTTGSVINLSNAGYMALMAFSPIVWAPMSQVYGRKPIALITAVAFFFLSLGTALAPNLAAFFVFRAISAFEGTAFILIGAASLGDIYRPTERGTAMGWFMSGTLFGPAFGPFLGGIIVTFSSWRTIFWLQTALAGAAFLGLFFLVPETIHHRGIDDLADLTAKQRARAVLRLINPFRALRWFRRLNVCLVTGASSSLVWNMYSLLTPIRYVLNPRFNLETPLLGGLFYLAPGLGYLLGTLGGGRFADWTVKRWILKRGARVPEDRLRSAMPWVGILIPGCMLIYGWAVDQEKGGIALPVIVLFLQGIGQLMCFPSLNTYCLDVVPGSGAEVAASNFFMRYLAGALGTSVVLPIVQSIGIGWFSTISAALLVASAGGMWIAIQRGDEWTTKLRDAHQPPSAGPSEEPAVDTRSEEPGASANDNNRQEKSEATRQAV